MSQYVSNRTHGRQPARRHSHRGGAMVEFALVLPIMLTVLLGIVDLARAIQFDNVLVLSLIHI